MIYLCIMNQKKKIGQTFLVILCSLFYCYLFLLTMGGLITNSYSILIKNHNNKFLLLFHCFLIVIPLIFYCYSIDISLLFFEFFLQKKAVQNCPALNLLQSKIKNFAFNYSVVGSV